MEISLRDRVAWITGGGEGIGRAVALLAAECGAKVAVTGRDLEPLVQVVSEIEQRGGQASAVTADVSNSERVQAAVKVFHVNRS